MVNNTDRLISIVIPIYNEQDNLQFLYQAICTNMKPLPYNFEIIFVDDGSSDATPLLLETLANSDERVTALLLARNFGHQIALTCGLEHAGGDAVITMDGDMQHPPALLPKLIEQWEQGFDVVQTIRIATEGVGLFKKVTSSLYYKMINSISKVNITEGGSDFRLLDRKVVDSFKLYRERARFIRGIISSMGFRQTTLEFVAPERHAGQSKFSLNKMIRFALDGITAFSNLPLRMALYLGLAFGMVSFGVTMHVLYIKIFTTEAVPGWTTIAATISLLGGLQLIGLGIIGEYVGRIFEEVKARPLYLVQKEIKSAESHSKNDFLLNKKASSM